MSFFDKFFGKGLARYLIVWVAVLAGSLSSIAYAQVDRNGDTGDTGPLVSNLTSSDVASVSITNIMDVVKMGPESGAIAFRGENRRLNLVYWDLTDDPLSSVSRNLRFHNPVSLRRGSTDHIGNGVYIEQYKSLVGKMVITSHLDHNKHLKLTSWKLGSGKTFSRSGNNGRGQTGVNHFDMANVEVVRVNLNNERTHNVATVRRHDTGNNWVEVWNIEEDGKIERGCWAAYRGGDTTKLMITNNDDGYFSTISYETGGNLRVHAWSVNNTTSSSTRSGTCQVLALGAVDISISDVDFVDTNNLVLRLLGPSSPGGVLSIATQNLDGDMLIRDLGNFQGPSFGNSMRSRPVVLGVGEKVVGVSSGAIVNTATASPNDFGNAQSIFIVALSEQNTIKVYKIPDTRDMFEEAITPEVSSAYETASFVSMESLHSNQIATAIRTPEGRIRLILWD